MCLVGVHHTKKRKHRDFFPLAFCVSGCSNNAKIKREITSSDVHATFLYLLLSIVLSDLTTYYSHGFYLKQVTSTKFYA